MRKNFSTRITKSNFVIKLTHWEYWPFGIIHFPFFFYWIWLSLKARSLFFFSASNPGITMGGMLGESKYEILKSIPPQLIAKSSIVTLPTTRQEILHTIKNMGLNFPLIFKPDLGERGWMVERINNEDDITNYLNRIKIDFIIQECIDMPLEFGVFYRRFPSEPKGNVISIVAKEMLSVTGDGQSTLEELILNKDRAKLQWEKLKIKFKDQLNTVPPKGEDVLLVSIGNHCLGTKFMDGNYLINEQLSETFDRISKQIDGFNYGRFDLKTSSHDDLKNGNIKIVELNGCGAEPGHIYEPGFPLKKAIAVLYRHWKDIYRISMENHWRGVNFTSLKEGVKIYNKFKAAVRE